MAFGAIAIVFACRRSRPMGSEMAHAWTKRENALSIDLEC